MNKDVYTEYEINLHDSDFWYNITHGLILEYFWWRALLRTITVRCEWVTGWLLTRSWWWCLSATFSMCLCDSTTPLSSRTTRNVAPQLHRIKNVDEQLTGTHNKATRDGHHTRNSFRPIFTGPLWGLLAISFVTTAHGDQRANNQITKVAYTSPPVTMIVQ